MTTQSFLHGTFNCPTKFFFGENGLTTYLPKVIRQSSRVLLLFGLESVNVCGVKTELETVLRKMRCEFEWMGLIQPNAEYGRLLEIADYTRRYNPDLIIAVGGGSVIDGAKFVALAAKQPQNARFWELLYQSKWDSDGYPVGVVQTLVPNGTEWTDSFSISRRLNKQRSCSHHKSVYPKFCFVDPRFTEKTDFNLMQQRAFTVLLYGVNMFCASGSATFFDGILFNALHELAETLVPVKEDQKPPKANLLFWSSIITNAVFGTFKTKDVIPDVFIDQLIAYYGVDYYAVYQILSFALLRYNLADKDPFLQVLGLNAFKLQPTESLLTKLDQISREIGCPFKIENITEVNERDLNRVLSEINEWVPEGKKLGQDFIKDILRSVIYASGTAE